MDDLSSLDWNASKAAPSSQQTSGPKGNYYPTLRPTPPVSGSSTPSLPPFSSSAQKPLSNVPTGSRGSTPANDSFANLVSFNAPQSQPSKNLSLQEQQRILQEQKAKDEADRRRQFDNQFGSKPSPALAQNNTDDGRSTPSRVISPPMYVAGEASGGQKLSKVINKPFAGIPPPMRAPAPQTPIENEKEDDILAAFNASAPVDNSSHMPPSSHTSSFDGTTGGTTLAGQERRSTQNGFHAEDEDEDNDPFGLGMSGSKTSVQSKDTTNNIGAGQDDDDVLGLLGRPVSELPKPAPSTEANSKPAQPKSDNPKIRAITELVDMGFEPEKCKRALETTESGMDVQAAVGWLLNQAHEESKSKRKKSTAPNDDRGEVPQQPRRASKRRTSSNDGGAKPAWMREQERSGPSQRRQVSKSPAKGEKDPAQYASELSSSLFKTANSLWKTGQKKLNQAVSDLNSTDDVDPNQPKWMRDSQSGSGARPPRAQPRRNNNDDAGSAAHIPSASEKKQIEPNVTDEALLLEAGSGPPPRKTTSHMKPNPRSRNTESVADELPAGASSHREEAQKPIRSEQQTQARDRRAKLSRQAVEEEAATAYISPARRKKASAQPQPVKPEPDLLFGDLNSSAQSPVSNSRTPLAPKPRTAPAKSLPSRPPPPKRTVPPVSRIALQSSIASRKAGTEAFKRGDYGLATTNYTAALGTLPPSHPLTIILLSNRSLSHSKTGDPKASIADAITTLDFIGPSRGVGETIDLGGDEGIRPMDTYWGKAMTRKAEGFEHLERWVEAATAWRSCVEAGVGGATSIQGRNRCENAAKPKQPPTAVKKAPPRPRKSALSDLTPQSAQSAEAVTRLRAANAAADQLDDEKFRLADIVDGRVSRWRSGKEGNLRALLASLENVLWEDAGWKKTGMGELIQTNKVKIVYMRGIGKVHPDKLPTTATTEQKMISAAVFATLNEAWERFKAENGM